MEAVKSQKHHLGGQKRHGRVDLSKKKINKSFSITSKTP
jgi:hypothetical protein